MGQNKVAYRKSASYVAWKCLKSPGGGGVVGSYPLLSQAPTPVEVELGCDNSDIHICTTCSDTTGEINCATMGKCEICQFRTNDAMELSNHANTHEQMKKCRNCDFTANTEFAFQLHIESEHRIPPVLTFPCPTCGLTFGDIKDLDNHVKRCHTVQGAPELSKPESDMKHHLKYII